MHRRPAPWHPLVLCAGLALAAAACGGGRAQWTFYPTPASTPGPTGSAPATGCSADATVVKIEETAALKMVPTSVDVSAGAKVCFEVTNAAGFAHNLYVGPAADIESRTKSAGVVGTPDFLSGTQMVEWTATGTGPFEYACWIPGHLEAGMKGTVAVH